MGHKIDTGASVLARLGGTLVYIILTSVTSIAGWTLTHIAPHVTTAGAPVLARLGGAGIHLALTVTTRTALWTHTVVGAVLVYALSTSLTQLLQRHPHPGCSLRAGQALYVAQAAAPSRGAEAVGSSLDAATPILTGCLAAPVHWILTVTPREALPAGAFKSRVGGVTGAPVQTGPGEAGVGLVLAVCARVARATQTAEGVHAIHTGPSVEAGAGAAVQQVVLTVEASVTRWAGTGEGGHVVGTGARAAGAAQTFIHISSTARTSKAIEARTGKGAHTVLAGAAVEARVGVTVVDILITERASVPPVADAPEAPGQVGAGPVGAARRGTCALVHILLAPWALPAWGTGTDSQPLGVRLTVASVLTEARSAGGQHLTLMALESRGTGAAEAYSVTGAGATSLAGLGLTGIWSQTLAAAGATPPGFTHTAEPTGCVMADSVTTGLVGTGMVRR